MIENITQLLNDVWNGHSLDGEDILRLILLGLAAIATMHLLTMLVTRWGDRNVAAKSFVFSLAMHACCWIGLATAPPVPLTAATIVDPPEEERTEVRELLVESEQTVQTDDSGNTPVWEELAQPETDLARLEHQAHDLTPPEAIERDPEQPVPQDFVFEDVKENPDAPMEASIPDDQGQEGPREVAAASLDVEIEMEDLRPEAKANSTSRSRRPLARIGDRDEDITREAQRGATQRIEPEFNSVQQSPVMQAVESPDALMTAGDPADAVRRKSGPVAAADLADAAGALTDNTESGGTGAAAPSRFSRLSSRRRSERPGRSFQDLKRQQQARTPLPLSNDYDQVRVSPAVDPLSESVDVRLAKPEFDAPANRRRSSLPATYRLRSLARRAATARQFGGTNESEQAVELSLRWLAAHQHPDGHWDASEFGSGKVKIDEDGVDRRNAGIEADSGVTALCVLAFLGAGYTHEEGKYASEVGKALEWLVGRQAADGGLSGNATRYARMYCHAMATYALAEAYGMQSDVTTDTRLRRPLLKAVEFIINEQNPEDGGWRYVKGQPGDMSMFGWQLMALKSAEIAGMRIPSEVRTRMYAFLRDRGLGTYGGIASYRDGDPDSPTMTAEALFCRQMLGFRHQSRASQEAVAYMLKNRPRLGNPNLYYWYYGTLSMYQYGGDAWKQWNELVREHLVSQQKRTGNLAGTWDPNGPWGPYGGRLYSTAIATLTLEVYYRFLPLYRLNDPLLNR